MKSIRQLEREANYDVVIGPRGGIRIKKPAKTCVRDTKLTESGIYVCPSESVIGKVWEGPFISIPAACEFGKHECSDYSLWHVNGYTGDAFRLSIV